MDRALKLMSRLADMLPADMLPPEKRDVMWNKLQAFANAYPKLAAFLITNVILTSIPLLCFVGFALTAYIASILGSVVVGLLCTASVVLAASFLLLPTIFLTTTICTFFLFLWVLAGYHIFVCLQTMGVAPSDEAIAGSLNTWPGGRYSWGANHASASKQRPKVEAKDSAVGLEKEPVRDIKQIAPHAEDDSDSEYDVSRPDSDTLPDNDTMPNRSLHSSVDSQMTVVGPTWPLPPSKKEKMPQLMPSRENAPIRATPSSPTKQTPIKDAPTGAGQSITYVKLRKEHPDGLRIDKNGLFKVDDIASDSSMEDRKGKKPVRSRSGNAWTDGTAPETDAQSPTDTGAPKNTNIDSATSTRAKEAATNADVEDNNESSNPSSGKSSEDLKRLMEETTSGDEINFSKMPPSEYESADNKKESSARSMARRSSSSLQKIVTGTSEAAKAEYQRVKERLTPTKKRMD